MAPSATTAATITIPQTLQLLDGTFSAFARGVAEDRYTFWLGSGISLGRVDGVRKLAARVVEFLRERATGAPTCPFSKALQEALKLAALSNADLARVDLARPFAEWTDFESITERLVSNYARLLDIAVDLEPDDYLLWEAVRVLETYANPTIQADVEHLCVALLAMEGVASEVATANWDGLIERATQDLAPGAEVLRVHVRPEDFREPPLRARLYKLHGCAVRARADESTYRELLIARQSQINGWLARPENAPMLGRLMTLLVSKPTVVLGLSAQDANIQSIFAQSESTMPWPWPSSPPAYVFSEDALGLDQAGLLKNVYRAHYSAANRQQIWDGSLIRAYAKPLLVALVLEVLSAKLRTLIQIAPGTLSSTDRDALGLAIKAVRDMAASVADKDPYAFVRSLVVHVTRSGSLFRDGTLPAGAPYRPLTQMPLQQMVADAQLATTGLSEMAVALGLLGRGAAAGSWSLSISEGSVWPRGSVRAKTASSSPEIFFVANSHAALYLRYNCLVAEEDDALVIHSSDVPAPMPRSPRGTLGRTGRVGLREVSIGALLADVGNVHDLMQRFREEVAI